jgi:hypothetical protein
LRKIAVELAKIGETLIASGTPGAKETARAYFANNGRVYSAKSVRAMLSGMRGFPPYQRGTLSIKYLEGARIPASGFNSDIPQGLWLMAASDRAARLQQANLGHAKLWKAEERLPVARFWSSRTRQ